MRAERAADRPHRVTAAYLRVFALSALGMAAIFYISTFLDLSDKVFKGDATWGMLGAYFWFATPQYVYYLIPIAILVAVLVTIGTLSKTTELTVMRACGYRSAARPANSGVGTEPALSPVTRISAAAGNLAAISASAALAFT